MVLTAQHTHPCIGDLCLCVSVWEKEKEVEEVSFLFFFFFLIFSFSLTCLVLSLSALTINLLVALDFLLHRLSIIYAQGYFCLSIIAVCISHKIMRIKILFLIEKYFLVFNKTYIILKKKLKNLSTKCIMIWSCVNDFYRSNYN